ncbi:class I SAM-dependent methyltransferase [Polaribacter sp. Z022]|uniref:class I SAM-dependent methyltransferase n=1 Tax=Polaribacter sp. Z022 TaxID=2927125 RepID=UPI0020209E47|nr:class I SAM-dependent methyltransferase [Polaribacter sp. Z022]MCL7754964.1 class I SAM-dependent methyltransferase [Polaribacter sp. Z022]
MNKIKKQPWPTKDAMKQVYEMQLWGNNQTPFYSGEGSHKLEIINPYIKTISSFLNDFKEPISVLDLGCGDFNIGKHFVELTKKYIAVDIVENLIDYNKKTFNKENLEFFCLNIAKDNLPKVDCVIIRQVLQHLSNKEVINIVEKLYQYKYIILTEHLPYGAFTPNLDIISGQGIRIKKQSGILLLEAPFNLKVKEELLLHSYELVNNKGVIKTILYQMF